MVDPGVASRPGSILHVAPVTDLLRFLRQVRQSNLLSESQWELLQQSVSDAPLRTPGQVVGFLTSQGAVTEWQGEMLLAGRRHFTLGKYRLEGLLGTGAVGTVFLARQAGLERQVALKVLAPEVVRDKDLVARFQRETQSLAALNGPHLVTAFDAESQGDLHYLVMEYLPGEDLGKVLRRRQRLPLPLACECIRQALLGLQTAADAQLVHRDLKPGNLLLSRSPETGGPVVRILDFGLAKFRAELARTRPKSRDVSLVGDELTQHGVLLGTPDYMSPEQARETLAADIRSDLYSLGCTLYRLLTGEVPFPGEGTRAEIVRRVAGREREIIGQRAEIPDPLKPVLARFLAVDPRERYSNPREAARALEPFCTGARLDEEQFSPTSPVHQLAPPLMTETTWQLEEFFRQLDTTAETDLRGISASTTFGTWCRSLLRRRALWGAIALLSLGLAGLWLGRPSLTVVLPEDGSLQGEVQQEESRWQPSRLLVSGGGVWRVSPRAGVVQIRLSREGFEPIQAELEVGWFQSSEFRPEWQPTAAAVRRAEVDRIVAKLAQGPATPPREFVQVAEDYSRQIGGTAETRELAEALSRFPVRLDGLPWAASGLARLGGVGLGPAAAQVVQIVGSAERQAWNRAVALVGASDHPWVAAVSIDQTVQVWRTDDLSRQSAWVLPARPLSAGFLPGSGDLLVALDNGGAEIRDVTTGDRRQVLAGFSPPWTISADRGELWGVRSDSGEAPRLGAWDLQTGRLLREFPAGASRSVRSLHRLHTGHLVVEIEWGGVSVHEPLTGKPLVNWPRASSPLIDPGGQWLAVSAPVEDVQVYPTVDPLADEWNARFVFESAGAPLAFLPGANLLLTRSGSRVLWYHLANGQELRTILDVPALAIATGQPIGVIAADDSLAQWFRWDADTPNRRVINSPGPLRHLLAPPGSGQVWGAGERPGFEVWSGAGTNRVRRPSEWQWPATLDELGLQLACRQDDSIRIVDVVTGEVRQSLPRAVEEQEILSFSATGERLAVRGGWGVFRSSLEVWDLAKGAQVPLDNLPHGRVSALAWKPDDSALALAHDDRQVWIQDLRRGVSEALPCDLPALVRSIGFSADGAALAIGCEDRSNWYYDLVERRLEPLSGVVARVERWRFSRDGRLLLGVVNDRVLLYSVPRRKLLRSYTTVDVGVNDAAFSATSEELALATNGGRLELWDVAELKKGVPSRREVISLGPPGARLWEVRITPEGRHLVTLNGNSTVSVLRRGKPESEPADSPMQRRD